MSTIVREICRLVNIGELKSEFTVQNVQNVSRILDKSPAFLSKHCVDNPGDYTAYFLRVAPGTYSIAERQK